VIDGVEGGGEVGEESGCGGVGEGGVVVGDEEQDVHDCIEVAPGWQPGEKLEEGELVRDDFLAAGLGADDAATEIAGDLV
jgi:hypothetical protein